MSTDEAWTAIAASAEEEAQTALAAHGLALPVPFFLPALALAMPIWTPQAPNPFCHDALQALFSIDGPRLEAILEVLTSAGLLRKAYTYGFAPEELGHKLITETLAGPRGGELLAMLEAATWLEDVEVLENLAFAVPSPDDRSAAPLVAWLRARTKPATLYGLPSSKLLGALASAVPDAALEYAHRLLSWFPAARAPTLVPRARRRPTLFGPKAGVSGDELYPLLTGAVLADSTHVPDVLRVLADPRRDVERYDNRSPKALLEEWLDPNRASPDRVEQAFVEVEAWLGSASPSGGQLVVFDGLVRAIMRREVESSSADGMQIVRYWHRVPSSGKWLDVRERAARLVESALRHPSAAVRRAGVAMLYDLGEGQERLLERSAELEAHSAELVARLFDQLSVSVETERDFSVLAEIQRVTFWRWAAREGSPLQALILRALPRTFLFRLFVTAIDTHAIVDFEEVERQLGELPAKNDRWRTWVHERREATNRWGDELAGEIVVHAPTPQAFFELAQELERCGLDDAAMARVDRGAPLWLWKLARLQFAYFASVRSSEAFDALPAWLRFTLDDQWLQVSAQALESIERDTASRGASELSAEEVDRAIRALRYRGTELGAERMLDLVYRLLAHPDEDVRARVADDLFDWLLLGLGGRADEVAAPRRVIVTAIFTRLLVEEPSARIRGRTERWLIDALEYDVDYQERLLEHIDRNELGDAFATRFAESGFLDASEMRLLEWCAGGDLERWLDWIERSQRLTAIAFYFDHDRFGSMIQTTSDFDRVVARAERWQANGKISEDSRRAWLFQVGAQVPVVARQWVDDTIGGDAAARVRAAEVLAGMTERGGGEMDEAWAQLLEREHDHVQGAVSTLFQWTFGDIRSSEARGNEDPPIFADRRVRLARLRERLLTHARVRALIDETSVRLTRELERWRRRHAER